ELLVDRFKLVFLSLAYAFFSPLRRGFRADHEPALGHAIMAQFQAVITCRVVEGLPGVLPQRLAYHLGDKRAGVRNPDDKAQGLPQHRLVFAVDLAIRNEIARSTSL